MLHQIGDGDRLGRQRQVGQEVLHPGAKVDPLALG
jgi:hypothetical protein